MTKKRIIRRMLCASMAVILLFLCSCENNTESQNQPSSKTYTLTYAINSEGFGHITGSSVQQLTDGALSEPVCATPEEGYTFVSWSDGVTNDLRQGDSITEDTTITAIFELDMEALELPMVYINTQNGERVRSKEVYLNATMTISNTDEKYELTDEPLQIRGRGNSSWRLAKKPYRLKLDDAQNLLGQGSGPAKNWTLIANYADQSMMRNYAVYTMARSLSNISYTTSASFIELFLNGVYQGVYLLCEKVEVSPFRVDVEKNSEHPDTGFLLELDNRSTEFDENCFIIRGVPYVVESSIKYDEQFDFIKQYMTEAIDAIYSGDQILIEQYIDLPSAVDIYILEEYFKNIDSGWASFYLYKDAGGKLCFGPVWDFDISAGNDRYLDQGGYKNLYNSEEYLNEYGTHPNQLLMQLMSYDWFEKMAINRWYSVSDLVQSITSLPKETATKYHEALLRNFDCWQILGTRVGVYHEPNSILILNSYDEHVEYLCNWLTDRKDWMDRYFSQRKLMYEIQDTKTTDTATTNVP